MKNKVIRKIEERYADMRTSERKVADYVIKNIKKIPNISLGKLASECKVSEPTVLRMVKALGYQGLREFRNAVIEASSEMGLSKEEYEACTKEEQEAKCNKVKTAFLESGADDVILNM